MFSTNIENPVGDLILQKLILRTRSCGTRIITDPSWLLHFQPTKMVGRQCFVPLRYQLRRGISGAPALEYFCMIHAVGRIYVPDWSCEIESMWSMWAEFCQTGMGLHEGPQNRDKTQRKNRYYHVLGATCSAFTWINDICHQTPTYNIASPQHNLAPCWCPSILFVNRRSCAKSSTHSAWSFDRSHEADLPSQIQIIRKRETF